MAKINSSFQCMICKQPLNFPNDIGIIDFVILLLQFYKNHELCENLEPKKEKPEIKQAVRRKKKEG